MRLVSSEPESRTAPRRRIEARSCHAAGALARENEMLRAALRAPDDERRRDRAVAVGAADAARRRLECDLHDGAQQQLVAIALDLRRLEARVAGTDLAPVLGELGERLAGAVGELRELARGVYPAVLTSHGLGPALGGLAARASLPVLVDAEAIERMPAHVEATAYFVVAEALTNVARHADARQASVAISRRGGDLVVDVSDDGAGGADAARGDRPARPTRPPGRRRRHARHPERAGAGDATARRHPARAARARARAGSRRRIAMSETMRAVVLDAPGGDLYESGAQLPGPHTTLAGPTFPAWIAQERSAAPS